MISYSSVCIQCMCNAIILEGFYELVGNYSLFPLSFHFKATDKVSYLITEVISIKIRMI